MRVSSDLILILSRECWISRKRWVPVNAQFFQYMMGEKYRLGFGISGLYRNV